MQTGGLLALDLASRLGYCYGMPGTPPDLLRYHGWKQLPTQQGEGAVFCSYETWLRNVLDKSQPKLVVYETPFISQSRSTPMVTARRLIGLGVLTIKCCHEAHIHRVESASNSAVKKFMTSSGRADKLDVIFAVRQFGFQVTEDNEADAIAIWLWSEARHAPQVKRTAGALFAA